MAYVYRHTRLDKNIPFYIGIGTDERGKYQRAYSIKSRNRHWRYIVNNTEYIVEILLDNITLDEANLKEIEFIVLYGRIDLKTGTLCNLTAGGGGISGHKMSDETKKKMSLTRTGKKQKPDQILKMIAFHTGRKRPKETGKRISKSKIGKKLGVDNPFYGRKHSEESRKKISLAQSGEKSYQYGKKGELNHNYGIVHTKEFRDNLSKKMSGVNNPFFGQTHSEETILKMRIKHYRSKAILKLTVDGITLEKYPSANEAARMNDIDRTGINKCCSGKFKTYQGFKWMYK